MRIYENIHEAYLATLADIYDNPDCVSSPRGHRVREKFNYQFTITNPQVEWIITKDLERNKVIADYSKKEFELYNSCSNRVEDFAKASKFWSNLANKDGTLNSVYGYLIWKYASHGSPFGTENVPHPAFKDNVWVSQTKYWTPWDWCVNSLKSDKDTRQAILRFSLPEHFYVGNKDFVCTLHGYWSIRNDKLDLTINMRSNDMTLGLVYDMPWFISLMYKMGDELKEVYPDLQIGYYHHYVHNMHVYDRDSEKVLKMLGRN